MFSGLAQAGYHTSGHFHSDTGVSAQLSDGRKTFATLLQVICFSFKQLRYLI